MTIGRVELTQNQLPPGQMQGSTSQQMIDSSTAIENQVFASTLAKITSELMRLGKLSSSGGNAFSNTFPNGGMANGATMISSSPELGLLSMLVSAQQSQGAGGIPSAQQGLGSSSISGQDVVSAASKLEGAPYVWGGSTPRGFDCSGFTQYVYAHLGVQLPRTSEQQATVGTPVGSLANAQPGDLVFFAGSDGTSASPGHVGIYVGGGLMIDAPYTGTTVQIQSVSSAGPVVAIRHVLPTLSFTGNAVMGNVKVPSQYVSVIEKAASTSGIPPSLLAALLSQESGFNSNSLSPAGAVGIAQFMPATAAGLGINPTDPIESINGAAKLLASYTSKFGSYGDALAAYNAGASAVAKYGGIPPYPETQAYVFNVLSMAGLSANKGSVI